MRKKSPNLRDDFYVYNVNIGNVFYNKMINKFPKMVLNVEGEIMSRRRVWNSWSPKAPEEHFPGKGVCLAFNWRYFTSRFYDAELLVNFNSASEIRRSKMTKGLRGAQIAIEMRWKGGGGN